MPPERCQTHAIRSFAARHSHRERVPSLTRVDRWVWFNLAACVCGVLPVLLAVAVHNHGSSADPYCIRRCYTLVHVAGPGVLGFVAAPLVIALAVFALLPFKHARRGRYVDPAAWSLATISCLVCILGLFTSVGFAMLPAGALTVCAVATAP
jgi:hypothetical protein